MTDEQYRTKRKPILIKAGIDPRAIDYIINLERGLQPASIPSVSMLTKTASWEGRICTIAPTGISLIYQDGFWRLNL
jgi:hypothetical protein